MTTSMTETITITDDYILLSVSAPDDKPLSWETLQATKERIFPTLVFIEIYPSSQNIVNNANQRHLYHIRGLELPCLTQLENVTNYKVFHE